MSVILGIISKQQEPPDASAFVHFGLVQNGLGQACMDSNRKCDYNNHNIETDLYNPIQTNCMFHCRSSFPCDSPLFGVV